MCDVGDIILIDKYRQNEINLSKHSFVVISDEAGEIRGLDYNIVCNVLSSFKDEKQRARKLNYPGNFEILHYDTSVKNGNTKDGFIKAEQFFYFNKDKLDYSIIGKISPEAFNRLIRFIESLEIDIEHIIDNL